MALFLFSQIAASELASLHIGIILKVMQSNFMRFSHHGIAKSHNLRGYLRDREFPPETLRTGEKSLLRKVATRDVSAARLL